MRVPAVGVRGVRGADGGAVWTARSNRHRGHNPPVAWLVTFTPQVGHNGVAPDITLLPSGKRAASFVALNPHHRVKANVVVSGFHANISTIGQFTHSIRTTNAATRPPPRPGWREFGKFRHESTRRNVAAAGKSPISPRLRSNPTGLPSRHRMLAPGPPEGMS